MQNIHVGIMLPDVIILPRLVPPAEADHGRPATGEQILKSATGPDASIDFPMMERATEFCDHDRFSGRDLCQSRVCGCHLESKTLGAVDGTRRQGTVRA